MSRKNTLANKRIRRVAREDHAARMAKKRAIQTRFLELVTEPPEPPEAPEAEAEGIPAGNPEQDRSDAI